jgi:two-component system, NarL family, sensor kinase
MLYSGPRRLVLIFLFSVLSVVFFAQKSKLDSLGKALEITPIDSNKLTILLQMLDYSQTAEEMIKYGNEAYVFAEKLGKKKDMANCIGNIGFAYYNQGQVEKSLEYLIRCLKIHEEVNYVKGIAFALNNIGYILRTQGQYDKALEYYMKALKILEGTEEKEKLAFFLDNIGEIYSKKGFIEKALEFHDRALKIREKLNSKAGLSASYSYFGVIYLKLGQKEKALDQFQRALTLREELDDKGGIANSSGHIAVLYLGEKNYVEAEKYGKKALQAANATGYPDAIRSAAGHLSEIYNALGNYKKAYDMHKLFKLMADSVVNTETRTGSIKKEMQYSFEKKEEAARNEQEKKDAVRQEELKREKITYWSVGGILVLGLLSLLLLFNRKRLKEKNQFQKKLNQQQKEQAEAVMDVQEQERKRIAEDLHDSLGHLLSTAKLNLQSIPGSEKKVENSLQLLNQASEEIRNITFNLMPRTLEEGGLIPALQELASKVTNSGLVKVILHVHDMEKFKLEKQSQFSIYRIVQEAVNNILKHAAASEINIQLIGQSDHITIMIEDDGKGFDMANQKSGRGLKNIVTRSLWLKGNINIDSSPGRGTTITTEIPA